MKRIYKYQFEIKDEFCLDIHQNPEILTVDIQDGIPTMWILENVDKPKFQARFRIYGTGHPITDNLISYIDTFFLSGVWHLFLVHQLPNEIRDENE